MTDNYDELTYEEILNAAAYKFPGSSFLRKCVSYYREYGRLTDRQISALEKLPVSPGSAADLEYSSEKLLKELLDSGAISPDEVDAPWVQDLITELYEEEFEVYKGELF